MTRDPLFYRLFHEMPGSFFQLIGRAADDARLINSDQLVRVYLDDLPPASPDQFELAALELIAAKPEAALKKAQAIIPRLRASKRTEHFQQTLLQFIETAILYQFPHWSREEIEKMLQVTDVRQTRVFQEALEEGREKGREEGEEKGKKKGREEGEEKGRKEERIAIAAKLLEMGHSAAEISKATGLSVPQIRRLQKNKPGKSKK